MAFKENRKRESAAKKKIRQTHSSGLIRFSSSFLFSSSSSFHLSVRQATIEIDRIDASILMHLYKLARAAMSSLSNGSFLLLLLAVPSQSNHRSNLIRVHPKSIYDDILDDGTSKLIN